MRDLGPVPAGVRRRAADRCASGHVADFRHCIIILTTNLGATSHRASGLGFAPAADAFADEQIMRAIGQTFRPEFQNRLDKVIVFQPLTRDLMREILQEGVGPRAGAARPQGSRLGGRVGGLGAGVPAREGLLAGDGRAAAEARDRSVCAGAARRDHRRAALSRRRSVRLRAQRRPRHPGRVRRSRRRCGRQSAPAAGQRSANGRSPCRR